jgi:hypothetical protein
MIRDYTESGIVDTWTGLVVDEVHQNLYHDSYFYALVWDPECERVRRINYASTAYAGDKHCEIDAPPEIKQLAYDYLFKLWQHKCLPYLSIQPGMFVRVIFNYRPRSTNKLPADVDDHAYVHRAGRNEYGDWLEIEFVGGSKDGAYTFLSADKCEILNPADYDLVPDTISGLDPLRLI